MAKRYTDHEKWDDPWFQELPQNGKIAWLFLCDKCSWAGIWKVSKRSFEMYTGVGFCEKEIIDWMDGRVISFDDGKKWIIPSFVKFQQGELKGNSRFHASIISELNSNGFDEFIKPLISPLLDPYKTLCNGNGNGNVLVLSSEGSAEGNQKRAWNTYFHEFLEAGPPTWINYEHQAFLEWKQVPYTDPTAEPQDLIASAMAFRLRVEADRTESRYITRPNNFLASGAYRTDWANVETLDNKKVKSGGIKNTMTEEEMNSW